MKNNWAWTLTYFLNNPSTNYCTSCARGGPALRTDPSQMFQVNIVGDNRRAVARGLEKTGGVITSAALLFVIVAGAFTFTGIVVTKEMGLGMTVAVLVDAAIIRTLLVPATMRLLGRWNWWLPGRPLPPEQTA